MLSELHSVRTFMLEPLVAFSCSPCRDNSVRSSIHMIQQANVYSIEKEKKAYNKYLSLYICARDERDTIADLRTLYVLRTPSVYRFESQLSIISSDTKQQNVVFSPSLVLFFCCCCCHVSRSHLVHSIRVYVYFYALFGVRTDSCAFNWTWN